MLDRVPSTAYRRAPRRSDHSPPPGERSLHFFGRVGTWRGTLQSFSECPPPNVACGFHCTTLSSIVRLCLSVNVIPCFCGDVRTECPYGRYDKEPVFSACGKP